MTARTVAVVPNLDAENRWREWQARGAKSDRTTTTRMRTLVLLIVTALTIALFVQLA